MSSTIPVSEARAALPQILDRVRSGEEITLTRHGEPVAVVVRPDRLRSRRADQAFGVAERVHEFLERAKTRPLAEAPALSQEQADALIDDIRAGRSER